MPLNMPLYETLVRAARLGRPLGLAGRIIKIKNAGFKNTMAYSRDTMTNRVRARIAREGEVYQTCCPTCGDTRHRLDINYAWLTSDKLTNEKIFWPVHCYNEECQSERGFNASLERMLELHTMTGLEYFTVPAVAGTCHVPPSCPVKFPVGLVPVDLLDPEHPAVQFLWKRGHDPKEIAKNFCVSYCPESVVPGVCERLIIPIRLNGRMIGYQARYVGDARDLHYCVRCRQHIPGNPGSCPHCLIGKLSSIPKYYTAAGFKKSHFLFNYDAAHRWSFGILCEGPFDVMRVGSPSGPDQPGPAVAMMGKSLSASQTQLVAQAWAGRVVLILLDADAWDDALKIESSLRQSCSNVVPIRLPSDRDPGDLKHCQIWQTICQQMNWTQPPTN